MDAFKDLLIYDLILYVPALFVSVIRRMNEFRQTK